ncbi:MAG: hypothetical protein V1933_04200, partial [Candidatus Omnitrophota bacterium]
SMTLANFISLFSFPRRLAASNVKNDIFILLILWIFYHIFRGLRRGLFYQKIRDIYKLAVDYDPKAEETLEF